MSVDGSAASLELDVDLPRLWRVVEDAAWERDGVDVADVPMFDALRDGLHRVGKPHLVATLFAPLLADDGAVSEVITASLVVECFSERDMPGAGAPWPTAAEIVRGVEIAPGIAADVSRLTIPVYDDELRVGAVATFTTPNLPLAEAMEPGFRAIADSIRFVART